MKFCDFHWQQLRAAIELRGMAHLVSSDDMAVFKRISEEVEGTSSPETWDPLAAATWTLYGNAVECAGCAVLSPNDDGSERCPLCYGIAQDPAVKTWIAMAADGCLAYAIDNDLVDNKPATIQ